MKKYVKLSIVFYFLYFLSFISVAQEKFTDKSRATMIYQISSYVKWSNINEIKVFKIGVLNNDSNVYRQLVNVADTAKFIQKKPLSIVLFNNIEDIKDVQVVFVYNPEIYALNKIFDVIKGKKVLLISENYGFHQSMINFIVYKNEKHFDINDKRLIDAGLSVSQTFAALAIKSESVWNSYQKTDSMLVQEKLLVESQKQLINKQKSEIDEQQKKINTQKEELTKLFKDIITTQKTLADKQKLVNIQIQSIKQQEKEIVKQKEEVNKQQAEITKQTEILDNQKKAIITQEDKIGAQKKVLNEQLAKIEQQRLIMYLFIVVILMVSGLGYFIYRNYRIKKQANKLLQEKNSKIQAQHDELLVKNVEIMQQKEEITSQRDEIEKHRDDLVVKNVEITKQKEEITTQRDEIEKQRDIATTQRDHIIKQNKLITDSIVYAKRIQTAILPMEDFFKQMLNEYFILYRPKDIVSGDFFWETIKGNKKIIAVADCTGHGVPGAFMSMLGISYLNEIVIKENIERPDEILNHLREHIVRSLKQQGKDGEVKDGMDISLFSIDFKTNKLQFAGANNHLTLIRNNEISIIEADKMPISIYLKMESFNLKEVDLIKGDTIYANSDGFGDQFGGPARKKFMSKRLRQTFLEMQALSMADQKTKLEQAFEEWRGDTEQIDDVLVVGIRI